MLYLARTPTKNTETTTAASTTKSNKGAEEAAPHQDDADVLRDAGSAQEVLDEISRLHKDKTKATATAARPLILSTRPRNTKTTRRRAMSEEKI